MLYLPLLYASVSKMWLKVIASLLSSSPAYERLHMNALLSDLWGSLRPNTHSPPSRGQKDSPELIHHPHQHEKRVLAHTLLECVGERRELLIRGTRVKETAVLEGRGGDMGGGLPSSGPLPEQTLETWGGWRPVWDGRAVRWGQPAPV